MFHKKTYLSWFLQSCGFYFNMVIWLSKLLAGLRHLFCFAAAMSYIMFFIFGFFCKFFKEHILHSQKHLVYGLSVIITIKYARYILDFRNVLFSPNVILCMFETRPVVFQTYPKRNPSPNFHDITKNINTAKINVYQLIFLGFCNTWTSIELELCQTSFV